MFKRLISFLLCAALLLGSTAWAAEEYNTAEKLQKQLAAGSGFSADLKVDVLDAQGNSLLSQPIPLLLRYISVKATDTSDAVESADLTLQDPADGSSLTTVQFYREGDTLLVQADLLGDSWYTASSLLTAVQASASGMESLMGSLTVQPTQAPYAADGESPAPQATEAPKTQSSPFSDLTAGQLLGLPELLTAAEALLPLMSHEELSDKLDTYTTRVDLWLEGYRSEATVAHEDSGVSTLTVTYRVPASAVKAGVKSLVMDLLEDEELLESLKTILGEEYTPLLNPAYRQAYFTLLDELPLEGDLVIERQVTMQGDTLYLNVSLPLYDAETGSATLNFVRTTGKEDSCSLSIGNGSTELKADFTHQSNEDGSQTWAGQVCRKEGSLSAAEAISLTWLETEGRSENNDDTYTFSADLALEAVPGTAVLTDPFRLSVKAEFASQTSKTAATYVTVSLTYTPDGGNTLSVTAEGRSRKKWEVTAPEGKPVELGTEDGQKLLLSVAPGLVSILSGFGKEQ